MLAHHWRAALELAARRASTARIWPSAARRAPFAAPATAPSRSTPTTPPSGYYEEALALWPARTPSGRDLLFRRAHALYLAADERR